MKSAEAEASPLCTDELEPSGDWACSSDGLAGLREQEELGETGGLRAEQEVDGIAVSVGRAAVVE